MGCTRTFRAWGVKWSTTAKCIDGKTEHLYGVGKVNGLMFATRADTRQYISLNWGYIKTRSDLRDHPHGWNMPKAVRISVTVTEIA